MSHADPPLRHPSDDYEEDHKLEGGSITASHPTHLALSGFRTGLLIFIFCFAQFIECAALPSIREDDRSQLTFGLQRRAGSPQQHRSYPCSAPSRTIWKLLSAMSTGSYQHTPCLLPPSCCWQAACPISTPLATFSLLAPCGHTLSSVYLDSETKYLPCRTRLQLGWCLFSRMWFTKTAIPLFVLRALQGLVSSGCALWCAIVLTQYITGRSMEHSVRYPPDCPSHS